MGVQGLWELLTPVGRRVSVETLAGRKLAIGSFICPFKPFFFQNFPHAFLTRNRISFIFADASIWIIQFMKAMRDDRGEMVRNAHLIGFFRRICKLLFLRVKPVFVFDGGTPALKRRTVIARRRQRENAQAKIRKTAEKLLLNHLRTRKLEDLARQIHNPKSDENSASGKNEGRADAGEKGDAGCSSQAVSGNGSYEASDALLAASLAAEGQLGVEVSTSPEEIHSEESEDMDESDQMILPVMQGKVDPSVLAVLPPSMQLDLLVQMREQLMADNRQKFQKVKKAPESFSQLQIEAYLKTVAFRREIEEVQKSAAGRGIGGMQTSRIASESGREFVFSSSFSGDKQALQFPGSNTGETEGGSATKEKDPDVSLVQSSKLNSSLLSSTFAVQPQKKASDGNSDPPVQTYIDEKGQVRVSRVRGMGVRLTRDLQWNLYLMKESEEQAIKTAENSERGSDSNRAIQKDEMLSSQADDSHCQMNEDEVGNSGMADISYENESFRNASKGEKEIPIEESNNFVSNSQVVSGRCLQISFSEDEVGELSQEDELFAALVAGKSVPDDSRGMDGCNQLEDETSECEWEEGQLQLNANAEREVLEGRSVSANVNQVSEVALIEGSAVSGDSEVEWEEGNNIAACDTTSPSKGENISSRGLLSEEEELEEAIRRSLEDFHAHRGKGSFSQLVMKESPEERQENISRVDMPVHVFPYRKGIGGSTDKVEGKYFFEEEKERGKAVLNEEVDELSGLYNSKLKGHIEQSSQKLVEKSEIGPKFLIMEGISSEKCGVSASVSEKVVEGPYFLRQNDMQQSATLQEFLVPKESSTLNEVDKYEKICQPDGKELQNEYKVHTLNCAEPVTVGLTVADNITSGPKFVNSVTEQMLSCSDGAVPLNLDQAKAVNQHRENLSEENLIREAEEADSSKDREALLEKEAELLAMKEEHLRRKEKIQAELEAEKEAMQAGMDEEMAFLRQEELDLRDAQKKNERNAESVTGEMFAECQELLQIFGLPYIIAPMEAEAQCAFMELAHLVDGVVTDDCDAFLFGAGTVYKNIFDERKYVETYLMKDVEEELGLSREKLVRMALLLGSDYTEGISGIGIVNAIEVVNAFPDEDGLKKFREWLDSPDPLILNKVEAYSGKSSRKRSLKSSKKTGSVAGEEDEGVMPGQSTDGHQEEELSEEGNLVLKQIFMEKHRAVSKNWHVPESFPNEAVISAYIAPQVDKSTEPFSWGRPDLMSLRKLCWEKFGWAKEKADELLLPVLKEYDRHETQLRLEAFYSFNERFAKIRSRRIQKAVTGITGRRSSETMDLPSHLSSTPQKRPRKKKENSISDGSVQGIPDQTMGDARNERVSSDVECSQNNKNREQERKKGLDNNLLEPENTAAKVSTTGRGKGRGRGRRGKGGASRGRGRREEPRSLADHSGSEEENEGSEQGQLKRKFSAEIVELRKSTRPRKDVNYAPDEQGSDSECHMYNGSDNDMSCEASTVKAIQKQPATSSDSFKKHSEEIDLQTNLGNTSIEHLEDVSVQDERLYSDYLATGGGFCTEEENHKDGLHTNEDDENDNVFPTGDTIKCSSSDCVQVGLSNDFSSRDKNLVALSSGGGFCVSEEADCLASGKDLTIDKTKELEFNDGGSADVITEREPRTNNSASAVGLRAIPFLRRKKRNSN